MNYYGLRYHYGRGTTTSHHSDPKRAVPAAAVYRFPSQAALKKWVSHGSPFLSHQGFREPISDATPWTRNWAKSQIAKAKRAKAIDNDGPCWIADLDEAVGERLS
jgi:hypothetical protein